MELKSLALLEKFNKKQLSIATSILKSGEKISRKKLLEAVASFKEADNGPSDVETQKMAMKMFGTGWDALSSGQMDTIYKKLGYPELAESLKEAFADDDEVRMEAQKLSDKGMTDEKIENFVLTHIKDVDRVSKVMSLIEGLNVNTLAKQITDKVGSWLDDDPREYFDSDNITKKNMIDNSIDNYFSKYINNKDGDWISKNRKNIIDAVHKQLGESVDFTKILKIGDDVETDKGKGKLTHMLPNGLLRVKLENSGDIYEVEEVKKIVTNYSIITLEKVDGTIVDFDKKSKMATFDNGVHEKTNLDTLRNDGFLEAIILKNGDEVETISGPAIITEVNDSTVIVKTKASSDFPNQSIEYRKDRVSKI